ncbi:helix-turn-helix domain-containing protein [Streptomyces sp. NPDC048603]|uniref:AraC-like ligand-binding domain-containing protein n=1 Tax=Streptomyces sp. NPDC048603 TaxID=3365577 RepID=UPI00371BAD34
MWQRISAGALPAAERFDWYNDVVARTLLPTALSADRDADFHAEAAALPLGVAQLSEFAHSPLRSRRTPALIRRGDPEQYQLALMTRGRYWLSQCRSDTLIGPGDMILWDTSHPHEAASMSGPPVGVLILQLPREAVPLPTGRIDRLLGLRIPADAGTGAVLADFIGSLDSHAAGCAPAERAALGSAAVQLAAACLAGRADPYGQPPAEFRAQVLRRQIDAFIEHHLGDPALGPGAIAAHHHISVRTLHELFRGRPEGVAASIRRRRLERCRADLARPDLGGRPVQAVAARWGYTNASAFSRAFREAFGVSPRDFRHGTGDGHRPDGRPARSVGQGRAAGTLRAAVRS